jgi:hypothetical protein
MLGEPGPGRQRLTIGDVCAGHGEARHHRQAPERIVHRFPSTVMACGPFGTVLDDQADRGDLDPAFLLLRAESCGDRHHGLVRGAVAGGDQAARDAQRCAPADDCRWAEQAGSGGTTGSDSRAFERGRGARSGAERARGER